MLNLTFESVSNLDILKDNLGSNNILEGKYLLKDKVILLITRDLLRLGWSIDYINDYIKITPPHIYDKKIIKESMSIKRNEIIKENRKWIDKHILFVRENLANGYEILQSKIEPIVEICTTQKQHDLFRILRYYWSSPYSEYVGRRIKLIIRDNGLENKPVIGIAALGSPIIHIPERDTWVGWDKKTRTERINYTMDAYIIGALPPYNYLLGGKLISYILATKEVRKIYHEKYINSKYDQLAGIFTTSLYGKSSQYNKIKYRNRLIYNPIGETKGYGTLHLTKETFNAMNDYLKNNDVYISNEFGAGPSWSMRIIRNAGRMLGFNADVLLKHSFKRQIYFVPSAKNSIEFLNGKSKSLKYYQSSISTLAKYWENRWLKNRKKNNFVVENVKRFDSKCFNV